MAESKAVVLPGDWLSLEETMKTLGIARRTLQTWAKQGKVRSKQFRLEGRRPAPVYHAQDVERLKAGKEELLPPAPRRAAAAKTEESPAAVLALLAPLLAERKASGETEAARLALEEKRFAAEQTERERARLASLLWLSLDEAAAYSGLTRETIRHAAVEEKLTALKAGAWRIRRASLEAFAG